MAIPSYTTDLQTFNDASNETGWVEFTGMTLGAPPGEDIDLAIYGTQCITSDRAKVGLNSNGYDGTAVTLVTDGAFFIWHKFFAPNSLDTIANGGIRVAIGSSLSNYYAWYVGGSDTYAYGGWVNFAVDPRIGSPDMTTGTPAGTFNAVANGWKLLNAPSKGNPFNTDIIRYGRGISEFTAGDSGTPATFNGYALVNDNPTTGRFGLFQAIAGGYLFKGVMSLGTDAAAVYMRDSNVSISIDDNFKVLTSFTRIEIRNAASDVGWTNVSFAALGTHARGQFEMIANATFVDTGGTFTGMDTFIYQSNATLTGRTWRGCNQVAQGGATMDGCTLDSSTATYALSADAPNLVTNTTFSNNATALYIPATVTGTITLNNDTFAGNTTDIYWAGTVGTLIVSKTNGSNPVTTSSAGGTVSIVASSSIDILVQDQAKTPLATAYVYINDIDSGSAEVNTTTNASGLVNTSYAGAVSIATLRVRKYGYKPFIDTVDISQDLNRTITLIADPQQI